MWRLRAIGLGTCLIVAAVGGEAEGAASRAREVTRKLVGKVSRGAPSFALWLSKRRLAERWLAGTDPHRERKPAVFESRSFRVVSAAMPYVDRADGGHLVIFPKVPRGEQSDLTADEKFELAWLSGVTKTAMRAALASSAKPVKIGIFNTHDDGNWSVDKPGGAKFHLHIYGRSSDARVQTWGQALVFPKPFTGFYDRNQALTDEDLRAVRIELKRLLAEDPHHARWAADS